MAQKVLSINIMYPALAHAHNTNNKSAINKKICEEVGLNDEALKYWVGLVEQNLFNVVSDYYFKKDAYNHGNATQADVDAARELIFPTWREALDNGEVANSDKINLHIEPTDVDHLFGYIDDFMATARGTMMTVSNRRDFRKSVEKLIGCRMTGNSVLTEKERDNIRAYQKACTAEVRANDELVAMDAQIDEMNESISRLDSKISYLDDAKAKAKSKEAQAIFESMTLEAHDSKTELETQLKVLELARKEIEKKIEKAVDDQKSTKKAHDIAINARNWAVAAGVKIPEEPQTVECEESEEE